MQHDEEWLTLAAAADRVGVSVRSIRRYIARDGLAVLLGRVRLSELLEVEGAARKRKGGRGNVAPGLVRVMAQKFVTEHGIDEAGRRLLMDFAKSVDIARA